MCVNGIMKPFVYVCAASTNTPMVCVQGDGQKEDERLGGTPAGLWMCLSPGYCDKLQFTRFFFLFFLFGMEGKMRQPNGSWRKLLDCSTHRSWKLTSAQGGTVAQWLALSPHSNKARGVSWMLHF